MSLGISVLCHSESTGKYETVHLPPGKHLAGFEESRYDYWGSEVMKTLGLMLLPKLADGGFILVKEDRFDQLEQEAHTILANVETVLAQTHYDRRFVEGRAQNIVDAVRLARDIRGEVMIG